MKRKNNSYISQIEPPLKKIKYSIIDFFLEIENTFKKFKIQHNIDCKLNLKVINNTIIPIISIDDKFVNPYYIDYL